MKRSTPIPPERSRQVAMAFDSHKMLGMSPRQREAVLVALANLLMEATEATRKEEPHERA
ncbi:hypothetical protein HNR59_003885 [Aquamicrobium lusatiense]|uniref:Uncharacterized protein n=1 Tax=Aquamicrobium lusatiense TaxID=89772 RepID=A0A7W9VXL1_9HYPH|nr:hypothetical protein [Aquamicrobium lusatiense]MBB6014490.1 hypothetical protein [Aquamicrobium lusatiense]